MAAGTLLPPNGVVLLVVFIFLRGLIAFPFTDGLQFTHALFMLWN